MPDHIWTSAPATINGEEVESGGNFQEAVTAVARSHGYRTFRVLMGDTEIDHASAPATVPAGANITVLPYDKAGTY